MSNIYTRNVSLQHHISHASQQKAENAISELVGTVSHIWAHQITDQFNVCYMTNTVILLIVDPDHPHK